MIMPTTPQQTPSTISYEVTHLPAVRLVQCTAQAADHGQIGSIVGSLFERLLTTVDALGLSPDDPSLAWYEGHDEGVRIGVGMPAPGVSTEAAAHAGLEVAVLPAIDRAAQHRFAGSLQGLAAAWAGIHAAVRHDGLTPTGPCREVYLTGSIDQPDSWVIDIQQPLA